MKRPNLKMATAKTIDALFPSACWGRLCLWALGHYPTFDILLEIVGKSEGKYGRQVCREDGRGLYFCGKCYNSVSEEV